MDEKQKKDRLRLIDCIKEIRILALEMHETNPEFLESAPTEWVMEIMKALRLCAMNISDYRKFRKGLIKTICLAFVVFEYSDRIFSEYISQPAPNKIATLQNPTDEN